MPCWRQGIHEQVRRSRLPKRWDLSPSVLLNRIGASTGLRGNLSQTLHCLFRLQTSVKRENPQLFKPFQNFLAGQSNMMVKYGVVTVVIYRISIQPSYGYWSWRWIFQNLLPTSPWHERGLDWVFKPWCSLLTQTRRSRTRERNAISFQKQTCGYSQRRLISHVSYSLTYAGEETGVTVSNYSQCVSKQTSHCWNFEVEPKGEEYK